MGLLQIIYEFPHREQGILLRSIRIVEQVYNSQKSVAIHTIEPADLLYTFVTHSQRDAKTAEHIQQPVICGDEGFHLVPCRKNSVVSIFHNSPVYAAQTALVLYPRAVCSNKQ